MLPVTICRAALCVCSALWLVPAPALGQTTYSFGDGSTEPPAQLSGEWDAAGVWYDGGAWVDWADGNVARFFSPAEGGASVTVTNGSDVRLGGLVKQAGAANFTVLAQAGFALNFDPGATISVDGNTLATQAGAVNGTNLVVTGTTNLASTFRLGPGAGEAIANNINGLALDTITLKLSKANGVAAVGGTVVVNSGVLEHGAAFNNRRDNQYAAGSSLTINGGTVSVWSTTQALDSFTYNGGTFTIWANANMNLGGTDALTLRNVTLQRNGGSAGQRFFLNLTNNGAQTVRFDAANNGTAVLTAGSAFVFGGGVKTFNVENGTATTDMQVLLESISETAASSVRKTGAGVVAWNVASATNTYSGGMAVEEGALFFTRQAALPSSGVTMSNGATLGLRMTTTAAGAFSEQQFLDLHAGTLSGVTMGATAYAGYELTGTNTLSASLTGTRGLTKLGGGNLTLTGENTYSGGTFINQGNLQIGDGGTSGSITGDVVMADNADSFRQLIFNREDNVIFPGVISGSGSVRKEGGGVLTLSGNNNYSNATTVAAGTLIVVGEQAVGTAGTGVVVSDGARFELAESGLLTLFVRGAASFSRLQAATNATAAPEVLIDGRFAFDLSTAPTEVGTTWQVVATNLATTYGSGFLVEGFDGVNGGNWTNTTNGIAYVFSQAAGTLTVQEAGPTNAYDAWAAYWQQQDPSFTETAPGADPDGDSFNNDTEFAFGGNPTVGTPALLRAVRSGSEVSMSFIARRDALGSYDVLSTTNLVTGPWTPNTAVSVTDAPDQSGVLLPADYVRRIFQVTPAGKDFFRIRYEP